MSNLTPWFRVGIENPSPDRAGYYEVRFMGVGGLERRVLWTGERWKRVGVQLKPSGAWGDLWRGLREPAE